MKVETKDYWNPEIQVREARTVLTASKMLRVLVFLAAFLLTGCVTAVDDGLPYRDLPTVEVGVPVSLIASPSHPTSYLSSEMAAGTTVTVLGADPSQQWLFVADGNQVGWMPTIYSRNGVGRLEPAVTIDPPPADCTKYLDGTFNPEERWSSFTDGSVIVLGSILRPHAGDDFDDAELSVSIDGEGVVTTADYVHVLLTRSEAIVLFGVAIDGLERGSQISFSLENAGIEEVVPQAAFFANSCPDEVPSSDEEYTDMLPIGTYKRSVSVAISNPATDVPTPEATTGSTPQPSPVPPTPIVRESGPLKSSSSLRTDIELVLERWDDIHHEVDRTLDPTDLPLVLTGDALAQQRKTLQWLRDNDCYWIFEDLAPAEVRAIDQVSTDEVVVDARKHWDGDFYCDGEYDARSSFDDPFFVRYTVIRSDGDWRVSSKEVIDEDEVVNTDNLFSSTPSTPSPSSADQRLKDDLLLKSNRSSVTLEHRQQAGEYADALIAHLDEFRMPGIGVTEQSMRNALQRSDAGDRLNCLVQEVWDEWSKRARQGGFNAYTADPGSMGFSPFRQLTIRLIQDRQGSLSDAQQHALHNYFTRNESSTAWRNDPDGIIGAVNRESFRWP
ncbi:MAG: DUF4101 domain-containing protein [Caldilineaceae bacterium]|nr:DUF4101 domain-containing protein [Caldilineaceae bacterium]